MKRIFIEVPYEAPQSHIIEDVFENVLCQSLTGTDIDDWGQDQEVL